MMYYLPLMLTVIANIFYHIAQKYTSENINPIFSLFVTYFVATLVTAFILIFYRHGNTWGENVKELNWSAVVLGCAIVLLEFGFLLVYRAGWNIGMASIVSTITLTIVLMPIGKIFFQETIRPINIAGVFVSVIGIILMNYAKS